MKDNKVVVASLVIIVIFLAGVVLRLAKPVLFPFFLAVFLSFILSPALDFMTRLKIPKFVSILFIVIFAFFIIYLLGVLFYSSGKTFASGFPKYAEKISSILTSIQENFKLNVPEREPLDGLDSLISTGSEDFLFPRSGHFSPSCPTSFWFLSF